MFSKPDLFSSSESSLSQTTYRSIDYESQLGSGMYRGVASGLGIMPSSSLHESPSFQFGNHLSDYSSLSAFAMSESVYSGIKDSSPSFVAVEMVNLLPPPLCLGKLTSFTLQDQRVSNPLNKVREYLQKQNGVDIADTDELSGQIEGAVFDCQGMCRFCANVFRDSTGVIVVEFQRLSGCSSSFTRLYDQALKDLGEGSGMSEPLYFDDELGHNEELEREYIDYTLEMVASEYLEVMQEGWSTLASLSNQEKGCKLLWNHGYELSNNDSSTSLVALLTRGLACPEEEVRYLSTLVLANLSTKVPECLPMLLSIVKPVVDFINGPTDYTTLETKRKLCAALLQMAKCCPTNNWEYAFEVLKKYSDSSDDRIRELSREVTRCIERQ